MANRLRNIHVKKIDLVGVPAIGRTITLFKSGDNSEGVQETVNREELVKALSELTDEERQTLGLAPKKEELLKAISGLTDEERQELVKALNVEQKPLTADEIVKALAELSDDEEEDKDIPESVRKSIKALEDGQKEAKERAEKAEAVVKEMRDEQRARDYLARAEAFKHLPNVVPADFAPILSKIDKALKDEEREKLAEILKAADAAIAEGKLFEEIGRGEVPDAGSSALAKLNAKAEELRKADTSLTKEQAFTQATKENPELYNTHVRETELRKTRGED